MRRALVCAGLTAALALAGCGGTAGRLAFGDERSVAAPRPDTGPAYAMLDGAIRVEGPEGFCVDPGASRPARGFAVLAGCARISDIRTVPVIEGLITLQVGAEGSAVVTGSEATLRDLLQSGPGVQLLATDGRPGSIDIDRVFVRPGLVVVHFTDTAPPVIEGLEPLEWRAFLDLGDRLATVSVRGFDRAPLRPDSGLILLDQAVFALQEANRPPA